jgi:hypothetical protein
MRGSCGGGPAGGAWPRMACGAKRRAEAQCAEGPFQPPPTRCPQSEGEIYVVQLRTCSPCLALKNCAGVGGWGLALCVVSASAAAVAAALCWLLVATGDALAGAAFCATSPAAHTCMG